MKRRLALGYIGSFLIFAAFPIFRLDRELHVLGGMTDHASHWGAALLMSEQGLNLYREPVGQLCGPGGISYLNCQLQRHAGTRPFTVNWPQYPRVYPPGAMLLGAPEAVFFGLGWINYGQANLLFVLTIVAAAHLASLLLLLCLWSDDRSWQGVVLFLLLPIFHLQLVEYALRGIFDPAAILAVVGAIWLYGRGRPVAAVLAMSGGLFLHFRALWYLPLLVVLLVRVVQTRPSRRDLAALVTSGVMLAFAAWCFLTVLPAMRTFHLTNPFGVKAFQQEPGLVLTYGLPLAGIVAALAWNRSWLTLSVVAWQLFMLLQTREVQQWHALLLLPLFALAAREKRAMASVVAVLVLFVWEVRVVYSGWPITGELLPTLLGT